MARVKYEDSVLRDAIVSSKLVTMVANMDSEISDLIEKYYTEEEFKARFNEAIEQIGKLISKAKV